MKLSNKVYDNLKFIAGTIIPIAMLVVIGVSQIWGFESLGDMIAGTLAIFMVAISKVLASSSKSYSGDGTIVVNEDGTGNLELTTPIAELAHRSMANVRVDLSSLLDDTM